MAGMLKSAALQSATYRPSAFAPRSSHQFLHPCSRPCQLHKVRTDLLVVMSTAGAMPLPFQEAHGFSYQEASHAQLSIEPGCSVASSAVQRLFEAFNCRDLAALLRLVADECTFEDPAWEKSLTGKMAVATFYLDLIRRLPGDVKFVIDSITDGDPARVGVLWHVELQECEVPGSRAVGFYCVDSQGRIAYVREGPEHFARLAPLVLLAVAAIRPLFWAASNATPLYNSMSSLGDLTVMWQPFKPLADLAMGMMDLSQQRTSKAAELLSFYSPPAPQAQRPLRSSVLARQAVSFSADPAEGVSVADSDAGEGAKAASPPSRPAAVRSTEAAEGASVADSEEDLQAKHIASTPSQPAAARRSTDVAEGASVADSDTDLHAKPASSFPPPPATFRFSTNVAEGVSVANSDADVHAKAAYVPDGPVDLSGVWEKDNVASDKAAYEAALELWGITGIQKYGARFIEGMEIIHNNSAFELHFLTIIPHIKQVEKYSLQKEVPIGRRDMKSGKALATATRLPTGVVTKVKWNDPHAGGLEERYELTSKDSMDVLSSITVNGQTASVLQVWRRRNVNRKQLLKESENKHGSANDLLGDFMKKNPFSFP